MFQAQNREIDSTLKVAVSFKIFMTTSVTRSCFTKQHQICKTKTQTRTDFLVSDRFCLKTDGLRPHQSPTLTVTVFVASVALAEVCALLSSILVIILFFEQ